MEDLFGNNTPEAYGRHKKPAKGFKGEQCRDCVSCYVHQYRPDWAYCRQQPKKGTAYGHRKIKKTDAKCIRFERKSSES